MMVPNDYAFCGRRFPDGAQCALPAGHLAACNTVADPTTYPTEDYKVGRRRYQCTICPFRTNDAAAAYGHVYSGPPRGWLGENERHPVTDTDLVTDDYCIRHRMTRDDCAGFHYVHGRAADEDCAEHLRTCDGCGAQHSPADTAGFHYVHGQESTK